MKLPCLIIIAAFFASCSGEHGLQKQINSAIRSGQEEFVIPDGRYVLDKPQIINHVKNFTIRSARPGAVIITSATVLELKDFTCLDSVRRIYEISLP